MNYFALVPYRFGDNFCKFRNAYLLAAAEINEVRRVVEIKEHQACVGKVVDMQKFAKRRACSPELNLVEIFFFCFVKTPY